jgi:hypothetical protein
MLPEGCHARSSDETIVVLRRDRKDALYLLTLVSTRRDKSVRRGAVVKALGVATPFPHFISALRAPLIIALNLLEGDALVNGGPVGTESILLELVASLNAVDMAQMSKPTSREQGLMWRGVAESPAAAAHRPEKWTYR